MTTTEKLKGIRARCVELLAITEKRTPGEWLVSPNGRAVYCGSYQIAYIGVADGNAAFIASCAGAAEAGWRSTIAAIDDLLPLGDLLDYHVHNRESFPSREAKIVMGIITAWEGQI